MGRWHADRLHDLERLMLTAADRGTLENARRLIRAWGDTPLAANFDALVVKLGGIQESPVASWPTTARERRVLTSIMRSPFFAQPAWQGEDGG
jgi:hypothetical protein